MARAFSLVDLLALVAVFAFLAVAVAYTQAPSRDVATRLNCYNNLQQIGLAYRTWEGDYGDLYPMSVPVTKGGSRESAAGPTLFRHYQVMSNEINNPNILVCPADDRSAAANFAAMSNSNLSYFVGLDADESLPAMILSGDRNLITNGQPVKPGLVSITLSDTVAFSDKIHNLVGNVGLADGSVQRPDNTKVPAIFRNSRTNLTRLAVP